MSLYDNSMLQHRLVQRILIQHVQCTIPKQQDMFVKHQYPHSNTIKMALTLTIDMWSIDLNIEEIECIKFHLCGYWISIFRKGFGFGFLFGFIEDLRHFQCMPIIFMTYRSFSVILSSHIGNP